MKSLEDSRYELTKMDTDNKISIKDMSSRRDVSSRKYDF